MRLSLEPRLPGDQETLLRQLRKLFVDLSTQLNGVTEGRIEQYHNAMTAPPATETWRKGDFIKNSAPSELGSASSKYVVIGWICTASGTPGTWLQCRCLTGN
jgi:hypothetical protein